MCMIDIERLTFKEKMKDPEFREKFKYHQARLYWGNSKESYKWLSENCYNSCVFCEAPSDESGYCIICRAPIF